MSIYAYAAFIVAGLCLYFGTRRLRNRRTGLRAPLPHVTGTHEERYMRVLARRV